MRSFIAVELPESHRRRLGRLIADFPSSEIRWCRDGQLHITLKFLGDVADARLPEVCRAVDAASAAIAPFDLCLSGLGCFPSPVRPQVLWCGIHDPADGCRQWLAAAGSEFEALGFSREQREYTPHLTIGRAKSAAAGAAIRAILARPEEQLSSLIPAVPFRVNEIVVFASRLGFGGAVHTRLHAAPLAG